jgi:DHA2 family multidrug resistance protein-like MFS transporter
MPSRAGVAPVELPPVRRVLCFVAVFIATLMVSLDASIVNVALPRLSVDLHSEPADTVWVATAYLLAVASALPTATGLSARFSRKRLFTIGVPLFTLASLGCALSPTLGWLVATRVLQGVSASMVFAVAIPILRNLTPPQRLGSVLGINAMIVALGTCAGPSLSGLILAGLTWPWLFLINVPLGVLATVLGLTALPHRPPDRARLDPMGWLLGGGATATFLLGVHQLADVTTVWSGLVLLAACVVLVIVFIRVERRTAAPVIPLRLFTSPFSLAVGAAFWSFFGQGVAFVALPFLFQSAYGATPLQSALLFTPWPLIIVVVAPIMGRLADRMSSPLLAAIGLTIFTIGLVSLALLGAHPPLWQVLCSTALAGLGFAVFQSPNNRDMMSAAPLLLAGPAAMILNVNRSLGQSAGAGAVSMALILTGASAGSLATQSSAANGVLYVAVAGSAVAVVVSLVKLRAHRATRADADEQAS